jgi:hypothetical protein
MNPKIDRITNIDERVIKNNIFRGLTVRFSPGNTIEKYKNAAGIILGPTKLILAQNSLQVEFSTKKNIRTLKIQPAEAHENMENAILTRWWGYFFK